jgi:hypothetical protein
MFRTRLFWRFILALLLVGVLVAGGTALFRSGWAQGYQAGSLAASTGGSGASGTTPGAPFYPYLPDFLLDRRFLPAVLPVPPVELAALGWQPRIRTLGAPPG